jgi:hypothetical protein
MKIAICISGQPRTWEKCLPNLLKFISRLNNHFNATTDIFCHAWDFNTTPHAVRMAGEASGIQDDSTVLSQEEKQKLINTLQPISYLFENQETSKQKAKDLIQKGMSHINEHGETILDWAGSQFYGVMRAASLKKKHESDNGFKYDMCIKFRYDLFFDDNQIDWFFNENNTDATIPEYNLIYACHVGADGSQFPFHRMGDLFWYADSVTFDRICDFYRWIPIIGKKSFNNNLVATEHALYFYVKMLRMNIQRLSIDPKLSRNNEYLNKKTQAGLQGVLDTHELI